MDLFSLGIATLAAFRPESLGAARGDSGTRKTWFCLGDFMVVRSGDSAEGVEVALLLWDLGEWGGGSACPSPRECRRPYISVAGSESGEMCSQIQGKLRVWKGLDNNRQASQKFQQFKLGRQLTQECG